MRVVITGASGNVGTSVLERFIANDTIEQIVGVCRRLPTVRLPKVVWHPADVAHDRLEPIFEGADAVVHLAWQIQPARHPARLEATNVTGTARVANAVVATGVPTLVHASSVGTYAPGPKDRPVDENWPVTGVPSSFYSRHKSTAERLLQSLSAARPDLRVVRLRTALVFKTGAASGVGRLYNIAAEHSLDAGDLATAMRARALPVPPWLIRLGAAASFRAHLQPTPAGWVDLALAVPTMACDAARSELGWHPIRSATETLDNLLEGFAQRAGMATPPLGPAPGGRMIPFPAASAASVGR